MAGMRPKCQKKLYMPAWLADAVFYEIYPQSFYDSNGDGIGDIEGIVQKLEYVAGLGCNALWLNPCFDSPFKDAGYDVRDYKKVAARYGTNEDLRRLFRLAHERGMRVLLDLVPAHTSEEHPWFVASKSPVRNDLWNRYIWTDNWGTWVGGLKTIFGEAERNATYIVNFFKCQPALNYGFYAPDQVWQLPYTHPDCRATFAAMLEVMRFWLDAGCDGFRVDMAASLVKFDSPENAATCALWREVRAMLDREYPDAALVAEWSNPRRALGAGFHADFLLAFTEDSGYASLFRDYRLDAENNFARGPDGRPVDNSFFKRDGAGDITRFLAEYLPQYEATKNSGFISLVSGNHDLPRLAYSLSPREMALVFAFIFTMPGVPFLYYGDEIGMRYQSTLPSKEGGYHRTGSRTPMRWCADSRAGVNGGFSGAADGGSLYLPLDDSPDAPNVRDQEADSGSLLNTVKKLIALRRREKHLGSAPNFRVLCAPRGAERGAAPFVYQRGAFVVAVNPRSSAGVVPCLAVPSMAARGTAEPVFSLGDCALVDGRCRMGAQSFGVWKAAGQARGLAGGQASEDGV
jgi:maltose alpha-D-glucosyltransferase/alpha-amylase